MSARATVVFLDAGTLPRGLTLDMHPGIHYQPHAATGAGEVAARLAQAQVVITNKVRLGAAQLEAAPHLRLICVAAAGTDHVDLAAAAARGITVANVPDYGSQSVAEHVMACVLHLRRSLGVYGAAATDGRWSGAAQFCWHGPAIGDVAGSVLGIVGRGRIGRATAALAQGLGMSVLYGAAPRPPEERSAAPETLAATRTAANDDGLLPLQELLPRVDVLSLHVPLTPHTRGLMDAARLRRMKPGALLINTGRGALVEPLALIAALTTGQLAGAALDVLESEPPSPLHPLLRFKAPNLLITPHVAWASERAQQRLATEVERIVLSFVA